MASLAHGPCPRVTIPCSMSTRPLPRGNNIVVTRCVTRLSDEGLEVYFCRPTLAPPEEVPETVKWSSQRPLVILGLLAGYDTKPIEAGLGCDKAGT
ncbi:hypothetical protein CsSME_00050855 [Camellia sinensis var. sinensis]